MKVKVSFKSLKDENFSSTFPDVIYKPRKNILRVKVPLKYRAKRVKLKLRTTDLENEKRKSVKIFSTEYEENKNYVIFKYKVSFDLISFNNKRSRVVLDVTLVGKSSKKVVFTSTPFMVLSRVKDEDVFFNRPTKKKKAPKKKSKVESSCEEEDVEIEDPKTPDNEEIPPSSSEEEDKITGKKRKRKKEIEESQETKKQKT